GAAHGLGRVPPAPPCRVQKGIQTSPPMKKSVPEIQAILNEGGLGREPLAVAMVKGFELLSERIEANGPAPVTATQGTRLLVIGAYVVPVAVLALLALIVGPALRSRDAQLNDAVAAVQGAPPTCARLRRFRSNPP